MLGFVAIIGIAKYDENDVEFGPTGYTYSIVKQLDRA